MSRPKSETPLGRAGIYRLLRDWHGYLSAFAFVVLIFFAATGLLLNHPGLLAGATRPAQTRAMTLSAAEIAQVSSARDPGRVLAALMARKTRLLGAYRAGDVSGRGLFVRLQGVRGSSDLRADLSAGTVEVTIQALPATEVLNGLHRGELAGAAWRLWIDVVAVVVIALSLLGYALFLTMRYRLRTALILTAASLAAMAILFLLAAP